MNRLIALFALLLTVATLTLPGVSAAAESVDAPATGPGTASAAPTSGQMVSDRETEKPTRELVFLTWPDALRRRVQIHSAIVYGN